MATSAEQSIDQAPEEVDDVSLDEAAHEDQPGSPAAEAPDEDVLDILQPKVGPKIWNIGKGDYSRELVQRELSFLAKMEWFSLLGDVLDKALTGDDKMTLNNLFSGPQVRGGSLSLDDFRDADTFVQAIAKLLKYAPTFLQDSYCIWLNVPESDRPLVTQIMHLPPEQGGLSDDQGFEIIETFIDQNYAALESFFRDRLAKLQERVEARRKASESQRSKR